MKIYKVDKKWGVDYKNPLTGKRIREIVGENKSQAKDMLAKVRNEKVLYQTYGKREYFENINKKIGQKKLKDVIKEYLEFAKGNKKTADRDARSLNSISKYLVAPDNKEKLEDMYLPEITSKMIENYRPYRRKQIKTVAINMLEKQYVKDSTINRELSCLKHLFNKAIEWGYACSNPVRKVKFTKENNRIRYLVGDERERLLAACDKLTRAKYLKPIILLALNTGMRRMEILNLKWENIDFSKNLLYIRDSKNGDANYIPINYEAKSTLLALRNNQSNEEYVFLGRENKKLNDIRTAFKLACKEANIDGLKLHDLRHDFASRLVMRNVDIVTVKDLLRHKSIAMTLRYSHLSPKHKADAVNSLCGKNEYEMAENWQ